MPQMFDDSKVCFCLFCVSRASPSALRARRWRPWRAPAAWTTWSCWTRPSWNLKSRASSRTCRSTWAPLISGSSARWSLSLWWGCWTTWWVRVRVLVIIGLATWLTMGNTSRSFHFHVFFWQYIYYFFTSPNVSTLWHFYVTKCRFFFFLIHWKD